MYPQGFVDKYLLVLVNVSDIFKMFSIRIYCFHFIFLFIYLFIRLVYDRETGKPKGYGFCEYKDTETAQSAMRNLNGTEIHGRQLRVDSAASQKGSEDPRCK